MTKGGNKPRLAGARFELAVVKDQERIGRWAAKLRQGGGEVVDVVSIERYQDGRWHGSLHLSRVYLIQCKVGGYMSPIERERLVMDARGIGATPLMAWKSGGIQYKDIS